MHTYTYTHAGINAYGYIQAGRHTHNTIQYIPTYIHTYIHAYIHAYIHTYTHTYIQAYSIRTGIQRQAGIHT